MRHRRALLLGLVGLGLAVGVVSVTAQQSPNPRVFTSQQTHYLRWTFNYNSCVLVSGTCSKKVGAVPYNSFIARGYMQIVTNFNSGTSDTLAVGTSTTNDNIIAPITVHTGADTASAQTIVSTSMGTPVTGDGIAQSGTQGGFDIYTHYVQTGLTAPTAGKAVLVLEYFAPNDGSCAPVPLGETAAAC